MGSSDHNLLNWYSRIFQDQSARDHWAAFHIMRGSWEEAANYWPHTTESAYDLNLWGPCVDEFCVQVQKATPFYSGTIIVQSWSLAAQKHRFWDEPLSLEAEKSQVCEIPLVLTWYAYPCIRKDRVGHDPTVSGINPTFPNNYILVGSKRRATISSLMYERIQSVCSSYCICFN